MKRPSQLPMDVAVHLLSVCTLFSKVTLGTSRDGPDCVGRLTDPPVRSHIRAR